MPGGRVYLIKSGDRAPARCKIGRTTGSSAERCKALATGNPDKLELLHDWEVESDLAAFEREVHAHFSENRIRTEADSTEFFVFENVPAVIAKITKIQHDFIERMRALGAAAAIESQNDDGMVETDGGLDLLLDERRRISAQLYLLRTRRDAIDARLKQRIGRKAGISGGAGKTRLVTWKTQTVKRFDEATFKSTHPALHQAFIKESSTRRFIAKD